MSKNQAIPQHKRMAMGQKDIGFAKGGAVETKLLKTGIPTSPITDAKRANGIPGMKRGGRAG